MVPKVFPWSDASGLCPALHDADIWTYCFSHAFLRDAAPSAREDVKRVAKKCHGRPGVPHSIRVDDDRQFGACMVSLLTDLVARKRLLAELDKHAVIDARTMLAQGVYNYSQKELENDKKFVLTEVCDERPVHWRGHTSERSFIVPERIPQWLSTFTDTDPDLLQKLSIVASAFAILQPAEAARIYEATVSWNRDMELWLGKTAVSEEQSCWDPSHHEPANDSQSTAVANETSVTAQHPVSLEQNPSSIKPSLVEIRRMLEASCQVDQVVLNAAEAISEQLRSIRRTVEDTCDELVAKSSKIKESARDQAVRLDLLAKHPLLENIRLGQAVHECIEAISIGDANVALENAELSIATIEEFIGRHDELAARLGTTEISGIELRDDATLSEISESIELRILSLDSELHDRDIRIRTRDSLFENVRKSRPEDRSEVLYDLSGDKAVGVFCSLSVDHGLPESFDTTKRLRVGVLLLKRLFFQGQTSEAIDLWRCLLSCYPLELIGDLLCIFSIEELSTIVQAGQEIAPHIAPRLFTAIASDGRVGRLEALSAVFECSTITSDCRRLYLEFRDQFRRGTEIDLIPIMQEALSGHDQNLIEMSRKAVLSFFDSPPSLTGRYLQLRKEVQEKLSSAVRQSVVANNKELSRNARQSLGGVDELVEEAVRALPRSAASRIEFRHKLQTRRYIEDFDGSLNRWCDDLIASQRTSWQPLCDAIRKVLVMRHTNSQCQNLACHLEEAISTKEAENPFIHFEDRCEVDSSERLLVSVPWQIDPAMTSTWPASRRQEKVDLLALLADSIRCGLIPQQDLTDCAVRDYLEADDFVSAKELLPKLKTEEASRLKREIDSRRRQIELRHLDLLKSALALRLENTDIDESVSEFEALLEEARFDDADEWALVIEDAVYNHEEMRNPERIKLLDKLAAVDFNGTAQSLSELRVEWQLVQAAFHERRLHIDTLLLCANDTGFPDWLRPLWIELVETLDNPNCWPSAEHAYYLQETIPVFARYLTGKSVYPDDSTRRHIESVSSYILKVLQTLLTPNTPFPAVAIAELDQMIRQLHPERAIDAFIGASPIGVDAPSMTMQIVPREKRPAAKEVRRTVRGNITPAQPTRDDTKQHTQRFVSQWRATLSNLLKSDGVFRAVSRDSLGKLLEKRNWPLARRALAGYLMSDQERSADSITEYEATYAICCVMTGFCSDEEALKQCCIVSGAIISPFGISTVQVIPRVFVAALGRQADFEQLSDADLGDATGQALKILAQMSRDDNAWRLCHSILTIADRIRLNSNTAAMQIVDDIWDVLKNVSENASFRRDLLTLLFGMQRSEMLIHLTKRLETKFSVPASRLVKSFAAYDQELDEDSQTQILQSVVLLQHALGGGRNTRPWAAFFSQQLHRIMQATGEELPMRIRLESDTLYADDSQHVFIEIVLSPFGAQTVDSLSLQLGGVDNDNKSAYAQILVEPNSPLLIESARRVRFPASLVVPEQIGVSIAYRFIGHERYSDEEFSFSGSWQLNLAQSHLAPLHDNDIQQGWPGAQGKSVRSGTGFHGRKDELERLDSWLIKSPTPQSVMIFGQRRIGKSSLLHEQVLSMPASRGHMSGIYCSIDAMPLDGDLGVEFFRQVVQSIAASEFNLSVRAVINGKVDRVLDVDRLERECRPNIKIGEAFEKLLDMLTFATNGIVERATFFIDEFDRFVKPALDNREQEVDRFLWGLRNLMNSSNRIAFVLAGSGLARIFLNDQRQALWESVAQIELGAFKWPNEREAVADTLLPVRFRERICGRNQINAVVERAYRTTGGVPYYLAMLGYSLARVRHQVTPATLMTVMDKMVNGSVGGRVSINSRSFYAFAFLTLSALPEVDEQLSKYLLAELASLVPPEWPSIRVDELFDAARAELPQIDVSKWEETLGRLDVDFVSWDRERDAVCFSLPLMHAALRVDAQVIRTTAKRRLLTLLQGKQNA